MPLAVFSAKTGDFGKRVEIILPARGQAGYGLQLCHILECNPHHFLLVFYEYIAWYSVGEMEPLSSHRC
jgi:hypothetical protein